MLLLGIEKSHVDSKWFPKDIMMPKRYGWIKPCQFILTVAIP